MKLEKQLLLNTKETSNGRRYTIEALQSIADQINAIGVGRSLGRNGYPDKGEVALGLDHGTTLLLSKVSFILSNPVIEDNSLYVNIEVISSPCGEVLKTMIDEVVFRPMTMIADGKGTTVINAGLTYRYAAAVPKSTDALNLE